MFTKELRPRIENAIKNYNKYRSPEANAQLISMEEDKFIVSFTGSFCRTCDLYDYFEDLVYELHDDAGIRTKITTIEQEQEIESFKVTYMVVE